MDGKKLKIKENMELKRMKGEKKNFEESGFEREVLKKKRMDLKIGNGEVEKIERYEMKKKFSEKEEIKKRKVG